MTTVGVITPTAVGVLIGELRARGNRVLGPRRRGSAIVYDDIEAIADLPIGWGDEQAPGHYRLRRRDDGALFGFAVGPDSWKKVFFPPRLGTLTATRTDDGVAITVPEPAAERVALVGVRGCDLAAILVQDRVLMRGAFPDTTYAIRRDHAVLVAVDCFAPSATCFCASMGAGPRVGAGADLVLTELVDDGPHELLAEAQTTLGAELLERLDPRPAGADHHARAQRLLAAAAASQRRQVDADGVHDALMANLDHPRWDDVANRCLACGNCTLVCPTCFCSEVEDVTDLATATAHRQRRWASCFELDHSHLGGGSVRSSVRSRYRQWATHKLATWIDQFGTSGCVGCGRCITWCPVGIDLTAEVAAISADPMEGPR